MDLEIRAFPFAGKPGMTLHDHYVGVALQGVVSGLLAKGGHFNLEDDLSALVGVARAMADAVMDARLKADLEALDRARNLAAAAKAA